MRPGEAETPGMVGDWSKRKRFWERRQPWSDFNGISECLKSVGNDGLSRFRERWGYTSVRLFRGQSAC